jgi:hypothetical protein
MFGGENEGKQPLGKPKRRWEATIRIYLKLAQCKRSESVICGNYLAYLKNYLFFKRLCCM